MIKLVPPDVDVEGKDPTPGIIADVLEAPSRPKIDLSAHQESLRRLIHTAQHKFQESKDYWESRLQGIKRNLEDNWHTQQGPDYDYGELTGLGQISEQEWQALYDEFYAKGRGRPPANYDNPDAPPPIYLRDVYAAVAAWWTTHVRQTFYPKFGPSTYENSNIPDYDYNNFNAPARLLHCVFKQCDQNYSPKNTANLANKRRRGN